MLTFNSTNPVAKCDGLTRRDFLRVGMLAAGPIGLTLADVHRIQAVSKDSGKDIRCILLFLVGGPSQLETWDLKPDAPDTIRGPFPPIKTNVPGVEICEHFPRMAQMAERYAILRSVHHDAAPVHEAGHQLMQTGYLARPRQEHPHFGAVLSHLKGATATGMPSSVILPGPMGSTGIQASHGQSAGYLDARHQPVFCNPQQHLAEETELTRSRYGKNTFGQNCLLARRLVEQGVRFVTVNMFDTVFNQITWDCHGDGGSLNATLHDYQETLCPMFDMAYSSLLEDLQQRGMLETTLVLALGEFGRTPRLNPRGGRDHHPGVWSILFAGAGVKGGQVIGASDQHGERPKDHPISPLEVAASVYHGLGLNLDTLIPGPDGAVKKLTEAKPIAGLFK